MKRPVAQACKRVYPKAFGPCDAQVDLALAEIEKGSSLTSTEKSETATAEREPHLH